MRLIWYNLLLLSLCCILCHFHLTSMSLIIFFLKSCSEALHTTEVRIEALRLPTFLLFCWVTPS